jgi:DNA-binding MarR family transcriptional regulator
MAAPTLRPDIQAFAEIAAIDQMVTRAVERRLPAGLGRAQFNLMTRLAFAGDQSPGQLADYMVLTKGAVTNLLTRLQSQGMVSVRVPDHDSRRKIVRLTESGVRLLTEASKGLKDVAETLRAALSAEDFQRTLPLLSALRAHLATQIV